MLSLYFFILFSAVLGLVLAIPSNTCIVIVNLETIRKKGKLSPSDVIFLAKAIVNVLLQCVMTLQVMLFFFFTRVFYIREVHIFLNISIYFSLFSTFWLTAWLSVHYWTSITNLSSGFFIWIKRVVSHSLRRILVLTVLGLSSISVLSIWALNTERYIERPENSTGDASVSFSLLDVSYSYLISVTLLGSILPFCLSLLCLLLTVSFLVRHVWRVKNNDSGSTRPNLQAHVTALRTIVFFLLILSLFFLTQVIILLKKTKNTPESVALANCILQFVSPSVEAAVMFQASTKLRRFLLRRFWTRSQRNGET